MLKKHYLQEFISLLDVVKRQIQNSRTNTEEEPQVHFMFGFSKNDIAHEFVIHLFDIFNFPDDCFYTFLQGSITKLNNINDKSHNHESIVDDIELLVNELRESNSIVTRRTQNSSIFQNSDDSFVKMSSKRSSGSFKSAKKYWFKPNKLPCLI